MTLEGARALSAGRVEPAPFLTGPLPGAPAALVELDDLVRFAERPVRAFLRQRLGITVGDVSDEVSDALPVQLDALEEWGVGRRLLDGLLAGAPMNACVAAEVARGALPPGRLAKPVLDRVGPVAQEIAGHVHALLGSDAQPTSVDVKLALAEGRALSGTVAGVCGEVLRAVTYSRVNARHRLAAWVRLLALSAAHPDRRFESLTIGRARSGAPDEARVTIARIAPLRPAAAAAHLATLVDLWDRGMREPLPMAGLASAAYAQAAAAGEDAEAAGRKAWESAWKYPKEDQDLEHTLVFGGALTFAELLAEPPHADEAGDGWDAAETTRFGRLARRTWDGLLACEEVSDR